MLRASVRCGSFTSSPAKQMLFHASEENSDPTMAAPKVISNARLSPASPRNCPPPKLAETVAESLRPSRGTIASRARAATLVIVNRFCVHLAALMPRVLSQVRTAITRIATRRCEVIETSRPPPSGPPKSTIGTSRWDGETQGQRTPRNFAKATATAAMVPVWITRNSVHPYRKPTRGENASRR
jgi:hypothetical protein